MMKGLLKYHKANKMKRKLMNFKMSKIKTFKKSKIIKY